LPEATLTELEPYVALNTLVENNSDSTQEPSVSYEHTVSTTGTWNNTQGYEVGVKTSFTCGVPEIAQGSIRVSASSSSTHELGGSTMTEKKVTVVQPVSVPGHTRCRATATATRSKINVPFTYKVKV
ncbi:hypothetical protein C8R45DRAFT_778522, partial [Mycena sanguinolenta]